ncbi:MAG: Holliday junction branch migration protein RuvA [Gammaproteobacteria bacterium]|nr:Holliday junction branch migration protein RuvA [Gammaproteobacteria bacterium]
MIGQIRGILIEKKPPEILVDVGGLSYELQIPMSTVYQLPEVGSELRLHTHFVVREDAQLLYGFYDLKDKTLFRALIRANGVGPKMALAILSGMAADEFARTVRENDVAAMTRMPGIGRKTAERLIVEMRDRLTEWDDAEAMAALPGATQSTSAMGKEAETALIALGYKPQQAARSVAIVLKSDPEVPDSESLIRLALKGML